MKRILHTQLQPFQILIIIFFITIAGCSYSTKKVGRLYERARVQTYDVIVVPGVPLENGKWSPVMKARVLWSKHLYDRGIAKNVMYSGNAVYTPYIEAEVMAMYAEAIGIPREHIYTEPLAEHSTENIYYSYKKAQQSGLKKVALASDPFQTRMLKRFTMRHCSRDVDMIPMVYDTVYALDQSITEPVIDFQKAEVDSFVPLPERKGFWSRMQGTIGWDRDKKLYE